MRTLLFSAAAAVLLFTQPASGEEYSFPGTRECDTAPVHADDETPAAGGLEGLVALGLQFGAADFGAARTSYSDVPLIALALDAGATVPEYGDIIVGWRMASSQASDADPPLCGDLVVLGTQQLFDISYRMRFRRDRTVMPFVQAGPVLGVALYTAFSQSGCGTPPPKSRGGFTAGATAGAGIALRAGSLVRLIGAVDHLEAWTGYSVSGRSEWDRMHFTAGRLGIEFHF